MERYLVFYERRFADRIGKWLATNPGLTIYCAPIDDDIGYLDLQPRLIPIYPWNYLKDEELEWIDQKASSIAMSWYRVNGDDITCFSRISLGAVVEHSVMRFLVAQIKPLLLLPKLVGCLEIKNVVLFDSSSAWSLAAKWLSKNQCLRLISAADEPAEPLDSVASLRPKNGQRRLNTYRVISGLQRVAHRVCSHFLHLKPCVTIVASKRTATLARLILRRSNLGVQFVAEGGLGYVAGLAFSYPGRCLLSFVSSVNGTGTLQANDLNRALSALNRAICTSGIEGLSTTAGGGLKAWLEAELIEARLLEERAFRYLDATEPSLVVVLQDLQGFQRALVLAAKQKGVRSLTQQHGAVGFYPHFVAPVSDFVAVWGKEWSRWFTEDLGVHPTRIRVISDPFYSKYRVSRTHVPDPKWRRHHKIPSGDKIVLYAFQPNPTISAFSHPASSHLVACEMCRALGTVPKVTTILKMHPSYSAEMAQTIVVQSGAKNVKVIVKADNLRLLKNVDIVVTRTSTLGFEAALLGIPVITLDVHPRGPDSNKNSNPFLSGTFALTARSIGEAVRLAGRLLSDEDYRKWCSARQQRGLEPYVERGVDFVSWIYAECNTARQLAAR